MSVLNPTARPGQDPVALVRAALEERDSRIVRDYDYLWGFVSSYLRRGADDQDLDLDEEMIEALAPAVVGALLIGVEVGRGMR